MTLLSAKTMDRMCLYARTEMLDRMYSRDAGADGLFITGVITTGIYCLPSCTARKPKAKNVHFFNTENEAQQAGLRACKRCRPDYFYANVDPEQDRLSAVLTILQHDPASVKDVSSLANLAGIGLSKLYHLAERYKGTTPGKLIHQYRIEHAKHLFATNDMSVTQTAFEVGYNSVSAFYEQFKISTGQAPGAYQKAVEPKSKH